MFDVIGLAVGATATFAGVFKYFDYLDGKLTDKIYLSEQKILNQIKSSERRILEELKQSKVQ